MRPALLSLALICGCASLPLAAGEGVAATGTPVEVVGHVVSACGSEPVQREPVAIRAAGELEVLDSTETDASGAFSFKVLAPGDVVAPLFIEARGVRAVAKQRRPGALVADLLLPCTGG